MDAAADALPTPTKRRRWFQFRLRTVLLAMAILAIWLGYEADQARRQRRAVATVKRLGSTVIYDYQQRSTLPMVTVSSSGPSSAGVVGVIGGLCRNTKPRTPKWLRDWAGEDYFLTVEGVHLSNTPVTDADLDDLRGLSHLRLLGLGSTDVRNEL